MNETDKREDAGEDGWTLELVPRPPPRQDITSSDLEQQGDSNQKGEDALND